MRVLPRLSPPLFLQRPFLARVAQPPGATSVHEVGADVEEDEEAETADPLDESGAADSESESDPKASTVLDLDEEARLRREDAQLSAELDELRFAGLARQVELSLGLLVRRIRTRR